MDPLLGTLILLLLALVGARLSFSTTRVPEGWRLVFRTGTHFLLLGLLAGPSGLGLLTPESMVDLFPILALGLGWVGFHFGLQLDRDSLLRFSWSHHLLGMGQGVLTFLLFFGAARLILKAVGLGGELPSHVLLIAAATAAVTTPAGIAMVSSNFLIRGPVRDLLFFVGSLDAAVGIAALALTYSLYRPEAVLSGLGTGPQPALLAVSVGLGIVLGIVFLWLLRSRPAGEELVLYILGICAFAAGAALQWGLSPLLVSLVMGAVVANLSREQKRIFAVLERWEKPVYLTFLLLAGALLSLPTVWVMVFAFGYTALRVASKTVAAAAVLPLTRFDFEVPRRVGLGLVPQGGISLAMAVSGVLVYSGVSEQVRGVDVEAVMFTVIVIGVTLSEVAGPFLTVELLRRAGELTPQVEEALARGDDRRAVREALRRKPDTAAERAAAEEEESAPEQAEADRTARAEGRAVAEEAAARTDRETRAGDPPEAGPGC